MKSPYQDDFISSQGLCLNNFEACWDCAAMHWTQDLEKRQRAAMLIVKLDSNCRINPELLWISITAVRGPTSAALQERLFEV